MFDRNCVKALALIVLVLPFTGCVANGIDAITVSPTLTDFDGVGGTVQLKAIATIGHGSHPATYEDVTDQVKWSTPLAQVANVNTKGFVTMVGLGLTQITATANGFTGVVSGSANVCAAIPSTSATAFKCPTVSTAERPVARLSVNQGTRRAATPGESRQFSAFRTSEAEGQEDLTDSVIWTSSDETVATVTPNGLVIAVGAGKTTIMASVINPDKTVFGAATVFTVK